MTLVLLALAMIVCLALSFFFSGSETAIVSANRFWLRTRLEDGEVALGKLLKLLDNTQRLLVMVLIGTNVSNVLLALFFKLFVIETWGERAQESALWGVRWHEVLGMLVLTPVVVIFAEIAPKALFRAKADSFVEILRPAFVFFCWVLSPAIWITERLTGVLLAPLGEQRAAMARKISREDVLDLVSAEETIAETEGAVLEEDPPFAPDSEAASTSSEEESVELSDERRMVQNVIELHESTAGEIMTPLVELTAIQVGHTDLAGLMAIALESGFSRFPVYRERIVNLTGYIDIYHVLRTNGGARAVEDFIEPAYYVPETKRIDDLLEEFLEHRLKLAIVVDEFGGCVGWITREDILEEIVGEMEDELDQPVSPLREIEPGVWLVEARIEIEDLNEALGVAFGDESWETLAGLMLHRFGRIPRRGERIALDGGWLAIVTAMEGLRIQQARLERRPEAAAPRTTE